MNISICMSLQTTSIRMGVYKFFAILSTYISYAWFHQECGHSRIVSNFPCSGTPLQPTNFLFNIHLLWCNCGLPLTAPSQSYYLKKLSSFSSWVQTISEHHASPIQPIHNQLPSLFSPYQTLHTGFQYFSTPPGHTTCTTYVAYFHSAYS